MRLRENIQEVKNDTNLLSSKPDIASAISILDTVLSRNEAQSLSHSKKKTQESSSSAKKSATGSQIPDLPPILDVNLEKAVFTHPTHNSNPNANYDRLEVLGDAYIELMATKLVWDTFPGIPSGRVSQIRELLVKNETLAAFADLYGFSRKEVGTPQFAQNSKLWLKVRGDVFEAYVAAVILSDPINGQGIVERWLTGLWLPKLADLGHQKSELQSKQELAKVVMAKGIKLDYDEEKPSLHAKGTGRQTYYIGVYLTGWGWVKKHLGSGQGLSKNEAGDEAAKNALLNTDLISQISSAKKASLDNK